VSSTALAREPPVTQLLTAADFAPLTSGQSASRTSNSTMRALIGLGKSPNCNAAA